MQMDWQALDAGYEPDEEDQVRLGEVLGVNMVQAEETDGSPTEPVS